MHFKSREMIICFHLIRKPCAFFIIISKHALTKLHETKENKYKCRLVFLWRYMYIEINQGRHEHDVICTKLRSQVTFSSKCELTNRRDVKVG